MAPSMINSADPEITTVIDVEMIVIVAYNVIYCRVIFINKLDGFLFVFQVDNHPLQLFFLAHSTGSG